MTQVANHINETSTYNDHLPMVTPPHLLPSDDLSSISNPSANLAQQTHQQYQKKIADLENQLRQKTITNNQNYPPPLPNNQQWQTPSLHPSLQLYPFPPGQYQHQFQLQPSGRGYRQYCPRGGRGGGRGQGGQRQDTSCYCWSHGAGRHWSSQCNNPLPGHQYHATFENKMGGSTYRCPNAKAERQARQNQLPFSSLHPQMPMQLPTQPPAPQLPSFSVPTPPT